MKKFSENAVVATAKEMNDTGLFPHHGPTDNLLLWIKWHWSVTGKGDNFAPIVDITYERNEESTHKIVGEEMYFKLSIKEDGSVPFEEFINRFVKIERITITLSEATAILGKAYLKSRNLNTYDLRPFEFQKRNSTFINVPHLLGATEHCCNTAIEKEAYRLFKDSGEKHVESDVNHLLQLLKK